ncbi:MAG TPA: periplasmic heavy metal sensor [Nitrospiria bacterium]|nr:periplasmic heavy metal sensor [Nitrospiria bacterium]
MQAMMQTSKPLFIFAVLTALMLVLAPLGRAQMEEETADSYSETNDSGAMSSGGMGSMGQMGGQMGGTGSMGGMGHGGMMAEMSSENLKQRLGLTDDQAAKLKSLRSDYLKETTMQGAKVRVAEFELNDLLDEQKLDTSKIEKKVKEIESLKGELLMQRIRSLLKAADFLSPEQFAQFRAMTMRRMGAMHSMGGGPHPFTHPMGPSGSGPMPGQKPGMMNPHQ